MYYSFILGKNPILSVAEIFNYEKNTGSNLSIIDLTSKALLVRTSRDFDPSSWQSTLGGTIKIVRIIKQFKTLPEVFGWLTTAVLRKQFFYTPEKKNNFGFSLYGDTLWRHQTECRKFGLSLKKKLKQAGLKTRYVAPLEEEVALSSAQVLNNKMIKQGADIVIIGGLYSLYLGVTATVQDIEEYSQRDYGRPRRDAYSGMLPPKLAQIMLNLAGARPSMTLLDPFCGSGTVLQEASIMGLKKLIGADINQKAINDTTSNFHWLKSRYSQITVPTFYHTDIRELNKYIKPNTIDAIVSEPFLGPPINKSIAPLDMLATLQELESLYLDAFAAFTKILKQKGNVVIVFPLFKTKHGIYSLKILEQLQRRGFQRQSPLPEKVSLFAKVGPTARGSLVYHRPNQTVQRELFVFQYKTKPRK